MVNIFQMWSKFNFKNIKSINHDFALYTRHTRVNSVEWINEIMCLWLIKHATPLADCTTTLQSPQYNFPYYSKGKIVIFSQWSWKKQYFLVNISYIWYHWEFQILKICTTKHNKQISKNKMDTTISDVRNDLA